MFQPGGVFSRRLVLPLHFTCTLGRGAAPLSLAMPILGLAPLSTLTGPAHFDIGCARSDCCSGIWVDANENAHGHSISLSENVSPFKKPQLNGNSRLNINLDTDLDPILSLDLHRYPGPFRPK